MDQFVQVQVQVQVQELALIVQEGGSGTGFPKRIYFSVFSWLYRYNRFCSQQKRLLAESRVRQESFLLFR
jgi:hypothetical protein